MRNTCSYLEDVNRSRISKAGGCVLCNSFANIGKHKQIPMSTTKINMAQAEGLSKHATFVNKKCGSNEKSSVVHTVLI